MDLKTWNVFNVSSSLQLDVGNVASFSLLFETSPGDFIASHHSQLRQDSTPISSLLYTRITYSIMSVRELFGGALAMAMPDRFVDVRSAIGGIRKLIVWKLEVKSCQTDHTQIDSPPTLLSQFREVPDNQEVFGDPNTDQSIIVEILDLAQEVQVRPIFSLSL